MRILNVIQHDRGAYGAVFDRHLALRKAGIDSTVLCKSEKNNSSEIIKLNVRPNLMERTFFYSLKKSADFFGLSHVPNPITSGFARAIKKLEFDILHVCTARGTASYLAFPELTSRKAAIFTVSSMWSFTGHCFHSLDCDRWRTGCGKCPRLSINPPVRRDATRIEWMLKDRAYSHSNLTIITTSNWLTEQVKKSMLNRFPIHQIPHGIDTDIYHPLDPGQCRLELGIPPGKKVLMFASDRMDDFLKGGDLLLEALAGLPESLKSETVLLLMGNGGRNISNDIGMQTVDLGYVSDHNRKALCYSAADLFLFPTRAETFGLVSIESQACGTPVVSFRVGGVTDHVRPGITGYLAEPENAEDFRSGIIQLLEHEEQREKMGRQCRSIAVEEYNINLWAQRFIEVCNSIYLKEDRRN
ncbi:MAG: glycosyltransferase [Nitrospirae bacterium]|nr:glycosyltransferase [Nitrospirota bacterium]